MTTDERIDNLTAKMNGRFDSLYDYVLQFRKEAIERLEALERQFSVLSSAVVSIDSRLPVLDKAVVELELFAGRMLREKPEPVVSDWYERLTRLEEKVAKLIAPAA
jgi:SMC interacting uncharacterized protein involved in chromosome segregation